jgi:chemotaxis protein CheX
VKLEYLELFVNSTMSVLGRIMQTELQKGDVRLLSAHELTGNVVILIAIQNAAGESIILNMDAGTATGICGAMNGTTFEALNELGYDTLGEVANMIAGNAVTALNNRGFDFKISVPVTGSVEVISRHAQGLELFQVPVQSRYGEITVNFTMRTN